MTTIASQLSGELQRLAGTCTPTTVAIADPRVAELFVDFSVVDRLSCSFSDLRLNVPSLQSAHIDDLERWGNDLCGRITYLLENIRPLEVDKAGSQLLIRSTPPDEQRESTKFYEIVLKSHAFGSFSLRRYASDLGKFGRVPVDIQLTHEVMLKLVSDLMNRACRR